MRNANLQGFENIKPATSPPKHWVRDALLMETS